MFRHGFLAKADPFAPGRMLRALMLVYALSAQGQTSPLLFDPTFVDFGDLFEHEAARTNVWVFHGGDAPVTIARLGRTCPDCLKASLEKQTLLPGETTRLDIELCSSQAPGFFHEMITFEMEGARATPALPVEARIHPSYVVEGAPFLLTARDENDPVGHVVRITPRSPMRGELTNFSDTGSVFTVRVSPAGTSGSYEAEITVKHPIPVGMTTAALRIPGTDASDPPCWLDLSVFLPPPVHVYPGRLRLAPVDREQLRILFIEQRLETPASLVDVRVPHAGMRWEYLPGFSLERSRLNLYAYGMGSRTGFLGDVVIVMDGGPDREIRIPAMVDDRMDGGAAVETWPVPVANRRGCGCGSGR